VFRLKSFSANIDNQLSGKVAGYVSLIGAVPIISKYGQARWLWTFLGIFKGTVPWC
jgi:hypothetical protein